MLSVNYAECRRQAHYAISQISMDFPSLFHSKGDFQSNIKLQDKAASDTLTAPWIKLKLKKSLMREKENSRS